ncbi:TRL-like family protein [Marinobacter sp.]|uniref:TRL-like family protein n=1 Tax=Marinobacter sp. TaxID=50741 RepID=UPI0035639C80
MKKIVSTAVLAASLTLTGCATSVPVGGLFTDVQLPVGATANAKGTKVGTAKCQSILSLIAQGDCSIEAAKADGGITSVTHMDWKANNILGIIGNYELTVHGN